jgi:hypothetical protein
MNYNCVYLYDTYTQAEMEARAAGVERDMLKNTGMPIKPNSSMSVCHI